MFYWGVKCSLLFCQEIPEDLHHVQRPQPSWQDDLVINEQKTVLTATVWKYVWQDKIISSSTGSKSEFVFPLWHLFQADCMTVAGRSSCYSSISEKHSSAVLKATRGQIVSFCFWTECMFKNTPGKHLLSASSLVTTSSTFLSNVKNKKVVMWFSILFLFTWVFGVLS